MICMNESECDLGTSDSSASMCWRKININFTVCELCHFTATIARECAQSSCHISLPTALHMRNRLVISEAWKSMQRLKMARETSFAACVENVKCVNFNQNYEIAARKKQKKLNVGGVRAYQHHTTFIGVKRRTLQPNSFHRVKVPHNLIRPHSHTDATPPSEHWTGSFKNRVEFR